MKNENSLFVLNKYVQPKICYNDIGKLRGDGTIIQKIKSQNKNDKTLTA